jgi:hypothetical protein
MLQMKKLTHRIDNLPNFTTDNRWQAEIQTQRAAQYSPLPQPLLCHLSVSMRRQLFRKVEKCVFSSVSSGRKKSRELNTSSEGRIGGSRKLTLEKEF